jgi:long-subunit fatty acid transport protein
VSRLATAIGLAILSAPAARASFFDTYGFSARAVGRAGAMVALGFDYDAAYYNPANVLSRKRVHLGFGLDFIAPRLAVDALAGTFEAAAPPDNLGMHLGVSTPIGGVFDDVLGFGLAFFHPLTAGTSVTSVDPADVYWYRYDTLPDKLILAAALAVEPAPWLRLGVGAQVLAALDGEVSGAISLAEGRFLSESIDIEVAPRVAPTLGRARGPFDALPGLRLGLTYRGALELDYRLPVQIDIEQLGLLDVLVEGVSLYTPHQVAAGLGWESAPAPEQGLSLEAGLTWERWSLAPPAGARFRLAIDDSNVRPPTDPQDLPVDFIDVKSDPIPLGALDTLSPRAGLEWRPTQNLAVRSGYIYRPTPLPKPIYQTNAIDAEAHVMSLGVGVAFGDPLGAEAAPLNLDVSLQWTHLPARRVDKDPLAGAPQGAYLAGGDLWHISLDLRHDHF